MSVIFQNGALIGMISGMLSSLTTVILGFIVNRRFNKTDLYIKGEKVEIDRLSTAIAGKMADLKMSEIERAAANKVADFLYAKHERLRAELSELRALLDMHYNANGPFTEETKIQVARLCSSISLIVLPTGKFDEEFVTQLYHILSFFEQGSEYWKTRGNFRAAFDMNCWLLIGNDWNRIEETIRRGTHVDRHQSDPRKLQHTI